MILSQQPAIAASLAAVGNPYGQACNVTVTGGTVTGILSYPPASATPYVLNPALPASTVVTYNSNPFPVAVSITGGSVTVVSVNGSATGLAASPTVAVVPPGGTIALTYTGSPSWSWAALVAGFCGTSIPSPASLAVVPGGSIVLVYSVGPAWSWTNPINMQEPADFAAMNTTALPDEWHNLPYGAGHIAAGQAGLGVAVSN